MTPQQHLGCCQLAAVLLQAIAFILAIMAVCYSVVTTCVESRALDLEASQPVDDSELLPYRPEFFHAVFGLASAYLCMLYISWNLNTLPSLSGDGKFQVGFVPCPNMSPRRICHVERWCVHCIFCLCIFLRLCVCVCVCVCVCARAAVFACHALSCCVERSYADTQHTWQASTCHLMEANNLTGICPGMLCPVAAIV